MFKEEIRFIQTSAGHWCESSHHEGKKEKTYANNLLVFSHKQAPVQTKTHLLTGHENSIAQPKADKYPSSKVFSPNRLTVV